jgi:NAD(P)-dependent dehydrogenase (short-subunit alcohol dehydrogenase family)
MESALTGKTIVLTGVSRGVGLAAARALVDRGAHVLGVAREPDRLAAAGQELQRRAPGQFVMLEADLGEPGAASLVREKAELHFDKLDILVNNAGVMLWRDAEITEEPPGILEQTLEVNLLAPHRLLRELLPLLLRSAEPRVINVSSGAGTHHGLTEAGIAAYRVSKWALNGLTMAQARELSGRVAVNALDPGWLRTDLGGPKAPGVAEDGADGLLATLALPFEETGKFFKAGVEIPW